MAQRESSVTAEWAVWGRDPASGVHTVRRCSTGRFSRANFNEIIHRYHAGRLDDLPQVTIGWARLDNRFYLAPAIQEPSERGESAIRLFCVPFGPLAVARASYESLYHAFASIVPSESGSPMSVSVAHGEPGGGKEPSKAAMVTAAMLLADQPVSVLDEGGLDLRGRLRFLDEVAWLLPYGLRARLSVSTMARSTTEHHIRLAFYDHPRPGALSVVLDGPDDRPGLPPGLEPSKEYLKLLEGCDDHAARAQVLAREDRPQSFKEFSGT
jgi:hypothetical protein